ncbi:MAG: pilin [bacterium]|nr:pilin [bacterium]
MKCIRIFLIAATILFISNIFLVSNVFAIAQGQPCGICGIASGAITNGTPGVCSVNSNCGDPASNFCVSPLGYCKNNAATCVNSANCPASECRPNANAGNCDPGLVCANQGGTVGVVCVKKGANVWGPKDVDVLAAQAGLGTDDPREIVSNVINVIIGFLGIIAVVLIIAGGFMWMTAAGNDDKISTAKKMMTAGVAGLVILLAAFGISNFVVEALLGATSAT